MRGLNRLSSAMVIAGGLRLHPEPPPRTLRTGQCDLAGSPTFRSLHRTRLRHLIRTPAPTTTSGPARNTTPPDRVPQNRAGDAGDEDGSQRQLVLVRQHPTQDHADLAGHDDSGEGRCLQRGQEEDKGEDQCGWQPQDPLEHVAHAAPGGRMSSHWSDRPQTRSSAPRPTPRHGPRRPQGRAGHRRQPRLQLAPAEARSWQATRSSSPGCRRRPRWPRSTRRTAKSPEVLP